MNLVGAAGFVANGLWHGAIPSASLNILWMGIAAGALVQMALIRGKAR
jgi:hypothetical protein